jgi:hypothetical protein
VRKIAALKGLDLSRAPSSSPFSIPSAAKSERQTARRGELRGDRSIGDTEFVPDVALPDMP